MDGKDLRGASKQTPDGRRMLVAAVEHSRTRVLGQVDSKTNEIPAVRKLAAALDLAGRAVTLDALHAQQETARSLLEDCPTIWSPPSRTTSQRSWTTSSTCCLRWLRSGGQLSVLQLQ